MTVMSPITFFTHKGYAIKMVESIIKETNMDPCAEQKMEDLGVSGLFYLSRVCYFPRLIYCVVYFLADGCNSFSGVGAYEGTTG